MIGVFRKRWIMYVLSIGLFLGFGLKTGISITSKLSCLISTLKNEQPSEEEDKAKEDNSGRIAKKILFFELPDLNKLSFKDPIALEAHNRVYLFALIAGPSMAIPTQPPELV